MYNLFLNNDIVDYLVNGFSLDIKFSSLNIHKLSNMSAEMIRKLLLEEICSIRDDSNNQKVRLQRLIDKIFTYQPDELIPKDNKVKNYEQRIYGDIIATKGFLDDELVRSFILNDYVCSNKNKDKYKLLKKIIDFYDERSSDSIEKFNYCFRNSSSFSFYLLNDEDNLFDMILTDRNLSLFDKETLCQIFRFFSEIYSIKSFFDYDKDSDKSLYIISLMCDHVNMNIGHNSELIDAIVMINQECKSFRHILVEYYDRYVGNKDNEDEYRRKVRDNYPSILRELTNYMFMYVFDYCSDNYLNKCASLDIFLLFTSKNRENNSINILGKEGCDALLKNKSSDFLLNIDTVERLNLFKKSYLLNVYGISMNMARYICDRYGVYIEDLEKSIKKEDKKTLSILKAIKNIYYLELKDEEKINILQKNYIKYLKRYKLKCNNPVSVILIGLLNKMYINTYNKILFNPEKAKILEYDDGVRVFDASNKFKMIVTELNGGYKFYRKNLNYCSQWKTAAQDCNQGISTSFISNKNMGVISLNEPLLGFSNIYQYGLNVISSYDSFTTPKFLNLRRHNKYKGVFIPGNVIDSETRYGYNELLIDRYLFKSKDNDSKVMPDYVLFFKLDDKYKNSQRYRDSLQCARDFVIDLVIIDFNKVLDNELKEINDMEKELFKSFKVNKELLSNIIDRYMSNISGLRTFCGSPEHDGLGLKKDEVFIDGLDCLVDDVVERCNLIDDDNMRLEWIKALNEAYLDEKRKHQVAIMVSSYHCSLGHNRPDFLLDDIGVNRRVNNLFAKYDSLKIGVGDLSCEGLVLMKLFEGLGIEMSYDYEFDLDRYIFKKSKEFSPSVEEKLVIAYLVGNYEDDIIEEFNDNIDTKFRFGVNLSLEKGISSTPFAKSLKNCYDRDKLNILIDKVESISDMGYLSIFGPYINEMVYENGYRKPDLMVKLLSRKNNIRNEFNSLNKGKELVKRK